jgi:AraC family transcriptional regulator of adaptative response/methylated-DNA-[protein]-cysteine methyltransferase
MSIERVTALPENDARWQAVLGRDRNADGRFVYAVRSTGVYCRPSCPSRKPRRDQVLFFAAPPGAESAGFRSCRRCHPEGDADDLRAAAAVARACRAIESARGERLSLGRLAGEAGMSARHFHRTFRKLTGVTPRQYADACRLGRLKARLKDGQPLADATYGAGYGSSSRLYETAHAQLGMTPAAFRQGGHGHRLRYATAGCRLGRLLVAATDRGVSAVMLGDDADALAAGLRADYPRAEIQHDQEGLGPWLDAVLQAVEDGVPCSDLPLDVVGTAFQRRVWEELRRIPRGRTRSYAEVARRVGKPHAARAVARACATNPVAVVVPCHRVIGSDGSPTGYRWGVDRKLALLEAEGVRAALER